MADISLLLHEQRILKTLAHHLPTLSNSSLRLIPTSSCDAGLEDSWSFDSKKKNGEKMYATEYFTFALSEIFIPGDLGVDKRTENQDFVKFIELWACLF